MGVQKSANRVFGKVYTKHFEGKISVSPYISVVFTLWVFSVFLQKYLNSKNYAYHCWTFIVVKGLTVRQQISGSAKRISNKLKPNTRWGGGG